MKQIYGGKVIKTAKNQITIFLTFLEETAVKTENISFM